MKKNIWMIAGCMAALAIATTGCNNDELTEVQEKGKFTISAGIGAGADTRLSYDPSNPDFMKITWSLNYYSNPMYYPDYPYTDKISVFTGEESQIPAAFIVTELGADAHKATFKEDGGPTFTTPAKDTKLYAFYPRLYTDPADPTAMPLDFNYQHGTLSSDSVRSHFMYASEIADGTDNMQLSFKHITAMVQLELTFPEANAGDMVTAIGLSSPNMHNKATFNLTTGKIAYEESGKGSIRTMYIKDTYFKEYLLDANKQIKRWLHVLPEHLTNVKVIARNVNRSDWTSTIEYEADLSDCNLQAGNMYTVKAELLKKTP